MELRDELFDSLILDNTYIKLEDLDKKDKLEKIIPIVKDMKIVGECYSRDKEKKRNTNVI